MTVWLWIALVSNVVYWGVFFYLLSRRQWNKAALAVGVLHMLFAMPLVVAPLRSLMDPGYIGYGLGFFYFEGRAATLPATLILLWALGSAWAVVMARRGWWLKAVAVGDLFFAINLGLPFVKELLRRDTSRPLIQFGEHLSLYHPLWALVPLLLFVLPFVFSAWWVFKRSGANGSTPPDITMSHDRNENSPRNEDANHFLRLSYYCGSPIRQLNSFRRRDSL
jgi:hypothetical protein